MISGANEGDYNSCLNLVCMSFDLNFYTLTEMGSLKQAVSYVREASQQAGSLESVKVSC